MASVINTNMASLYAQKNLTGAQSALSTSVERLSSGLRINRAKDDAAGLGISEKLKSQIGSLNQGIRNANDAVSMVQTAEGSLSEVSNILQRMKELAVQGRNESLSDVQRAYIADELTALKKEVNAIAERTSFNGMSLLKNALRTQVADVGGATNKLANGASLASNLVIENLKVDGANVGSYTLAARDQTPITAVSNASVPATSNPLTARTVRIDDADVYEGARITINVKGEEYSIVAKSTDTATSVATNFITKLNRDFSGSVSNSSTQTITFASTANLGDDDISVSAGSVNASKVISEQRSTVDNPYDSVATARQITLNDFDIQEGRKVTISIGNPSEVAEFSTIVGAADSAADVATRLEDLIDNYYTDAHVSRASNVLTLASNLNLGMSDIRLRVEETSTQTSGVTFSSASDKNGVAVARTIEISDRDNGEGRVFSVTIDGKEYAYKATALDTENTVAQQLASLIDDDYAAQVGTAAVPTLSAAVQGNFNRTETAVIKFQELKASEAYTLGGITFTANRDISAAELAAAFANITSGSTGTSLQAAAGAATAYGAYAGANPFRSAAGENFTSGAVTTDGGVSTVTVTAVTASTNTTDIAASLTVRTASTLALSVAYTQGVNNTTQEVAAVNFSGSGQAGDVINVGNLTFTLSAAATATQVAGAIQDYWFDNTTSALGTFSGTKNGNFTATDAGAVLTLTGPATNGNYSQSDIWPLNVTKAATTTTTLIADAVTVTQGGASQTESALVTFATADMKAGDSISVGGLKFTATSRVTQAQAAAAFANLFDGATSGNGTEYGFYSGQLRGWSTGATMTGSGAVANSAVTVTSSSPATSVNDLTVGVDQVTDKVDVTNNIITLTANAKLGLSDINLSVYDGIQNAGKLKLTAGVETGLQGLSQTVDLGNIAAGASKSIVFDQMGVSFSVRNTGSSAVDASELFGVLQSKVNSLDVTSAMNGEALFQVGAAVRDTVVIDGFKDIRITGHNKNDSQAEREVFNNIHNTMAAIEGGNVDESIFVTLETQVEEAITTVSTFRSYFGAQQNRIDYAIANLQAQSENITEANSRIRDTDYAAETANLTKTQIMQQAATAMLAQANQMPNVILALLK